MNSQLTHPADPWAVAELYRLHTRMFRKASPDADTESAWLVNALSWRMHEHADVLDGPRSLQYWLGSLPEVKLRREVHTPLQWQRLVSGPHAASDSKCKLDTYQISPLWYDV